MSEEPRRIAPPPIHPLAALVTIVLDSFFGFFEIVDPLLLLFTSLGLGVLGFLSTTFTQRFLSGDSWGAAVAKGISMGIVAGIPFPVMGTAVGVPLLAWAGVSQWSKLPASRNNQIVDEASSAPRLTDGKE
jgi:hypothetical protein